MGWVIKIEPLRTGPEKAEPGLDGRAKVRLGGGQFVQQQREVQWNNTPNQSDMRERGANQLREGRPIMEGHPALLLNPVKRSPGTGYEAEKCPQRLEGFGIPRGCSLTSRVAELRVNNVASQGAARESSLGRIYGGPPPLTQANAEFPKPRH